MRIPISIIILFLLISSAGHGQNIEKYAANLKSLIEKNTSEGAVSYDHPETKSLEQEAGVDELLEITKPWLKSTVVNGRNISARLLSWALQKKTITQAERVRLIEALCTNLLTDSRGISIVKNILVLQHAKDFNENAKKAIASLFPLRFEFGDCARLAGVAQVKEAIPDLWKHANRPINNMDGTSLDILCSLARLGEEKAGRILCQFYEFEKNSKDTVGKILKDYVRYSKKLAFSLDKSVLDCLVKDFLDFDLSIVANAHYYWRPGLFLGGSIATMIKDYPDPEKFGVELYILKDWLLKNPNPQLAEK